MIMRADKGGATVVMNTRDYLEKAYALLNDTQTYLTLRSPPIATKMQQEFNRKLRKIANTLSDPLHKELVLSKISSRSPSVPYFYGVPKVHKPGCPLRPIIAACGSPQNTLAEWLAQVLSQFLGTFSSAHLQHSFQFIQRVKDSNWVDGRMASLDVTALFTNVPLDYVITKLQEEHDQGNVTFPIPAEQFFSLIRLCVSSTVFQFNNQGFAQKEGVAMGSPLTPVLANICMEFVEKEILNRCDEETKPVLWARYVDDIFIIFKGTDEKLKKLVEIANSILPSIKFTTEVEVDSKLPFLDVLVYRDCNRQSSTLVVSFGRSFLVPIIYGVPRLAFDHAICKVIVDEDLCRLFDLPGGFSPCRAVCTGAADEGIYHRSFIPVWALAGPITS
ncbi:uncharacterized protein LOC135226235 [Macrobrachium nipponense]|uniref:uncharacterized protein LOC135226235 n=1 Tax=Macrobrachium nipponense TaxID=159736 RepID=UPI0030C8CDB7